MAWVVFLAAGAWFVWMWWRPVAQSKERSRHSQRLLVAGMTLTSVGFALLGLWAWLYFNVTQGFPANAVGWAGLVCLIAPVAVGIRRVLTCNQD